MVGKWIIAARTYPIGMLTHPSKPPRLYVEDYPDMRIWQQLTHANKQLSAA